METGSVSLFDSVFVSVGILVALVGIGMIVWHVRQHRRYQEDLELSPADQKFYDQQYRRRMQTSALTVTLGALISLCENLPAFRQSPAFAAFYVLGLLVLSMWLVLLAFSDGVASRVHVSQSLRRNRYGRQALQEAVDELRRVQRARLDGDTDDRLLIDRPKMP